MEIKAVLLDMDGLMFDTERLSDEVWPGIAKKHGIEVVMDDLNLLRGKSRQTGKIDFLRLFGEDAPYDAIVDEVEELFEVKLSKQVPVKKGLVELLEIARKKNLPVAVASSSKKQLVQSNIKVAGLEEYISVIAAGDEVQNSKPAPDIFLLAAKRLGVEPEKCLVFEDSHNGVRAASAAGCFAVMVPDRQVPNDEMRGLTYKIVDDLLQGSLLL